MLLSHLAASTPSRLATLLSLAGGLGWAAAGGLGCAAAPVAPSPSLTVGAGPAAIAESPGARGASLAGARCAGGSNAPCVCRPLGDLGEAQPPDAAHKRFEIRLGALGGSATFDSPTLGHLAAGSDEVCFYIDVAAGTSSEVVYRASAAVPAEGVGPLFDLAEYGPAGPWWYDVLRVRCDGPNRRCNRDGADAWSAEVKTRKRGRIDPCGSTVISRLTWDTSGGTSDRELGLFRDFTVKFTMEVKKFATQFHPGAPECGGR